MIRLLQCWLLCLLIAAGFCSRAADTQINNGFDGPTGLDTWWWPNDPNAAVGPNHVMELINGIYRIYTKSGALVASSHIDYLFTNINASVSTLDPNIMYDDVAGRWIVEANGSGSDIVNAYLAVSDSSDPTQGFTEAHVINFPGAYDGSKAGFNADVVVICATTGTAVIDKSTLLDKNNSTFTVTYQTTSTFGRAARMHGSVPGGPMFWTSGLSGQLRVTRMDNVLNASPTINSYNVTGSSGASDPATPSWRNNSLVTANTGSTYWWQVNTSVTPPTLTQQGLINAPGGYTHAYGSATIAPNGDMGLSYMEYSGSGTVALPVSMYVAWRAAGDPLNTMRTPILAVSSAPTSQVNARHGDFSSAVCDIDTNGVTLNTFWSCNGYIKPNGTGSIEASWNQSFGGPPLAPSITNQPQNLTVVAGSPASFSVSCLGGQPFQYVWRKEGVPIAGSTTNPFTLTITALSDAGNYSVIITNNEGSVTSAVATLTVVSAYNGTWIKPANGSWTNSANWSGGVVATGIGKTADFSTLNITSNVTVTLDSTQSIGYLLFGDTSPSHNWTLNPGAGGNLTMAVFSGTPAVTVNNQTATFGIPINGTGGLAKNGAGTLALSVQCPYTGDTTINAGILDLTGGGGSSGTIRGTATVNSGGTLRLSTGDAIGYGGGSASLTTINLAGGTLNVNTTANQTLGSATVNLTGGSITGVSGGNIDFFGGGSALNTYASSVSSTISGVALSPLRQGSTTFSVAAGNTLNGIDLDISSVLRTSPSGDAAGATLVKAGAGVMRLSAANTYSRGTTISQGTLALGATGSISSSTPITIEPRAVFDVSALGSFTLGAGKVLGAGRPFSPAADINGSLSSGGVLNVAGQGVPGIFTINGNLSLSGGTLNYDLGAGSSDSIMLTGANRTLTLSGTTSITPSTGYQPNGSYVLISGFNSLSGTAANLAWGGISGSQVRGTPLAVLAATSTNVTVTIAGGTPANLLWKGTASGSWDVNTTLNWQNSLGTSDTFFNLDSVTFSNNPTTASVTVATNVYPSSVVFNNSSATAYTFSGPGGIGGGTSLMKQVGNGTVYLNVTNTYTGGTTISAGTVSLGNGGNEIVSALGTGPVTLNTGGTLMFAPGSTGNNFNIGNPFTFNGGTNWVEDGKQHLGGSIVNVAAGGATLNNKWGAKDLYIDSQLIGSGPLTLAHTPGGDGGVTGVHFTNPMNTYSGTITVNSSLTPAQVAHPNALANATINLAANNGLVWDGVNSIVLGALSGGGSIANGGGALSVGNNNSNSTYSGILSGTGSLTKMGNGTFTLSGANTYTGSTVINSGTLRLTGSTGAGSGVTVAGGTLSGTGQIYSPVTVLAGGTLSPGGSVGTLTISNTLTLAAASTSIFEISKTGGIISNDLVAGLTGVTFGGVLTVTNVTSDSNSLAAGDTFKLFNAGGFGGTFTQTTLPAVPFGLGWDTSRLTNAGLISVVSVVPGVTSFTFAPGNGFLLGGTGAVSRAYTLQMASNLTAPIAWALVATNVSDANGVFQFTDSAATNFPQRFYRVAVP